MLGIGENREWSYVGCDGPPYIIASRLVDEGDYEWVAMSNGLGHLYMNQQKTLFNIACDIILEPLAKDVLNFDSPNALLYFFKCADGHKMNQSLNISIWHSTWNGFYLHYQYIRLTNSGGFFGMESK